jgi:hypothetical protein
VGEGCGTGQDRGFHLLGSSPVWTMVFQESQNSSSIRNTSWVPQSPNLENQKTCSSLSALKTLVYFSHFLSSCTGDFSWHLTGIIHLSSSNLPPPLFSRLINKVFRYCVLSTHRFVMIALWTCLKPILCGYPFHR